MIVLATMVMPLFVWQIRESPLRVWTWNARLGDSFDDGTYLADRYLLLKDWEDCLKEDFLISRSSSEARLEQLSLTLKKGVAWLYGWSLIEIVLAGVYIWWYGTSQAHHPVRSAITSTVVAIILCWCLGNIVLYNLKIARILPPYSGTIDCFPGSIALSVKLVQIHYTMPIVLLAGILLEVRAFTLMVREVKKTDTQRNESSAGILG